MAQAKSGDTVTVHYTLRLEDGTVFDTSANREPLEFTIGEGQVIPGFEQAVTGMEEGESKTARIEADEGYGPHRDEMMIEVERTQFPPHIEPEVGQQYEILQPGGQAIVVTVAEISEGGVVLDANHPLAGEDLTFELQLVEIK